jgi:predicted ATPase/DNA-binding CsgD family transcriptional regulator
MVTAVERSAPTDATGGLHGFPAALTSFVGRAQAVDEVSAQLAQDRLVTVTGPGGAGKTRLAGEVARQVADRFADGVWLAELAAVTDPAQVAAVVGTALGLRDLPSVAAADALALALARRQLLLVLDNCEHVIGAAAELCGRLLLGADDVRVLATSREPLRIAGEVRYRLGSLTLPDPGDPAAATGCEAVTLFADRARRVEPGFTLDQTTAATVARLVARLDGMPLAIELAAARVDALGVAQLLDRIDDRFGLLADADRLAAERQRSLAAAVQWSYQLLGDAERRVFRAVSVFPGPFTLEAAEAVAGAGAGRAVPRLVDCSLVLPPRAGPDDRSRYIMLETLRAYGAGLLAETGEADEVTAALAGYAAEMAGEALAKVYTRTHELDGLRHLDAEDATLRHVLAWALEHDPGTAVRLALTIAPWWSVRGRLISRASLLTTVAELADAGSDEWCVAHMFLGQVAAQTEDPPAALDHFTAARDALQDAAHSDDAAGPWLLSLCLGGRASALIRVGRVAEAFEDGCRALELARQIGIGGLEATALTCLSLAVWHDGDREGALRLARQALQISEEFAGALERGLGQIVTGILTEAGDLDAAEQACAAALTSCRDVGDLTNLCGVLWHRTILDLRTRRIDDAPAHLRELLQIATRTGLRALLPAGLDCCGHLCAATGRPAEALTMWAAMPVLSRPWPMHGGLNPDRREQLRRQAREVLGPARARAAEERGAAMSLATATEFALLVAAEPGPPRADGAAGPEPAADGAGSEPTVDGAAGLARLSLRERQLVTLVAQGRTDAQIAAQLYITVRTVGSHLDRVRDKTGCRRRADLTRLALSAGLV